MWYTQLVQSARSPSCWGVAMTTVWRQCWCCSRKPLWVVLDELVWSYADGCTLGYHVWCTGCSVLGNDQTERNSHLLQQPLERSLGLGLAWQTAVEWEQKTLIGYSSLIFVQLSYLYDSRCNLCWVLKGLPKSAFCRLLVKEFFIDQVLLLLLLPSKYDQILCCLS